MNKNITFIKEPEIEMVKGFHSYGIHCGLKKNEELDLGLVISDSKCKTFAVYTTNKVQGAPLIVCRAHLLDDTAQALVVNSKVANTCTGKKGIDDSKKICEKTGDIFDIDPEYVIPMSTGVIGAYLPVEKIFKGIEGIKNNSENKTRNDFSKAIMTTDTHEKICGVKVKINDKEYSIVGAAKGSGMIEPNMATMLAFVFTDVNIDSALLKKSFTNSINYTLNAVTVDGDTSTNDTAVIFSNGLCRNELLKDENDDYEVFNEALNYVLISLSKMIASDGEGATKLIEVNVINAESEEDAKKICKSVANSKLVKTAMFGEDANWGRIICAAGYSGINFNPDTLSLAIKDKILYKDGTKTQVNENDLKKVLQEKEIIITIDLNMGKESFKVWTCDLTYDYIKINADYRT